MRFDPETVKARDRAMSALRNFKFGAPSPRWAYFAKLREQGPHVMATIDKVIERDAGRHKPTIDELDDYCRIHGLTPKSAWWQA